MPCAHAGDGVGREKDKEGREVIIQLWIMFQLYTLSWEYSVGIDAR